MVVIRVQDICGAADTAQQGDKLYEAMLAELSGHDEVVISFHGVDTATSSFVNTSFVRLLSYMALDDIKRRLKIVSSTHQINDMIKRRLTGDTVLAA
jgi:hypothetical protein